MNVRAGAYLARMLLLGGALGFGFFSTQFLQGVLHLRPLQAGLALLPVTLPNFASAMALPKLARRFGNERLLLVGLLLGVVGLLWLGLADADAGYWTCVAPPMLLIGLGQGLLLAPLTAAGVAGVAREDAGAASGMVNVAHQLGGAQGLGLLAFVFANAAPPAAQDGVALAHRISAVMDVGALLPGLALPVSWAFVVPRVLALDPGNRRPSRDVRTGSSSPAATGSTQNFTGIARMRWLVQAVPPGRASRATVSFEAAVRTAWHTHALDTR
jgi:MFS family permease